MSNVRNRHHAITMGALAALAATVGTLSAVGAPPADSAPSASAKAPGPWITLFDGSGADAFRAYKGNTMPATGWAVRDGSLVRLPGAAAGDIVTKEQFKDFEFVCEWRVVAKGNSGVIYRCDEDHAAPWESGPEMQILDDGGNPDASPLHRAGAMYDLFAPASNAVRPAGEWNEARVVARGPRIEHWLNGVRVVDADLSSDAYKAAFAKSKWKDYKDFNTLAAGHIALQDHGDEVWFRNIRVRRLD